VAEQRLHHVGFVVPRVEAVFEGWRRTLQAVSVSDIFHDPLQGARVVFLHLPPDGTSSVELVEPADEGSDLGPFIRKGGGLHHLCFEVDDLDAQLRQMRQAHAVLVRSPQPAIAFEGRRIAWMFTREKLLVEYLERA